MSDDGRSRTTVEAAPPGAPAATAAPSTSRGMGLARNLALRVAVLIALIALWWFVAWLEVVRPLFLPPPGDVWDSFVRANSDHQVAEGVDRVVKGEQNYYMWEHLIASLQRIGAGLVGAIVVGVPLGLIMATVRPVSIVVEPYLNFLRSLPPLAYIGLLSAWFGFGDASKIWLLFFAAFPPITMATISGVRSVREDQVNAALSLGASRQQVLRVVMVPATLPEIFTGIRVAVGFTWTCVVAAEISNGIPGIGGLAYLAGTEQQSDLAIACIIVIGLTAVALDLGLKRLELYLVPWRGKA